MTTLQAMVIAVLQGLTELFPISSLGHTVILPALLGWEDIQRSPNFLPLVVVMHLGTAVALFVYFFKDWWSFGMSVIGRGGPRTAPDRRLFLLVVVATIPAALLGFVLEKYLREAFATPLIAAAFLVVNGLILLGGEYVRQHGSSNPIDNLNWKGALAIGIAQSLALIPGISRSGITMITGVMAGLRHQDAARFSFLMAEPIIIGAAIHQIPKLDRTQLGGLAIASMVVAGIVAYGSTWFLMRYFRGHDNQALNPFAYYCVGAGLLSLVFLVWR